MPETEQQDRTFSELIVKEAVEKGMDTPLRESILEAVEESGGTPSSTARGLPLAGALFGLGAAVGFLAGREMGEMDETPLEDVQEPEIIEDVVGDDDETDADEETIEMDSETESEGSPSRLPRLLLLVGVAAGAAVLRRRFGSKEEEWEPIEEFEPATDLGTDDDDSTGTEMTDEQTADDDE